MDCSTFDKSEKLATGMETRRPAPLCEENIMTTQLQKDLKKLEKKLQQLAHSFIKPGDLGVVG